MPKVVLNKDGGSITYDQDDWLAGMDTTSAGANYGKMGGNPFMSQVDPLRLFGYLSPSFKETQVTGNSNIDNYLRNCVVNGSNAYFISGRTSGTSTVQKLTTITAGAIDTTAPFPHTIDHAHSNETGDDICNYYTGTTLKAFYSFSDATDWDVGAYNYGANTFDDDFMSTVPASPLAAPYLTGGAGYPHPLIVGDDDVLYIGDRNFVHAYDRSVGANGTFYPAVLTLPQGWIITCFETMPTLQLAIGAYWLQGQGTNTFNRGAAKVWFWSYLALDPDYARDLRDNYVSELKQWGGTIAAFTSGPKTLSDAGVNKLQIFDGNQFVVKKTWNTGGLPIRGGVDNVSNDLYWNSSGAIYSYTKRPDNGEYILNWLEGAGNGTSGVLKFLTASRTIHLSRGTTSDGGLEYFNSNYREVGLFQGQVVSPSFPALQKGKLNKITIKFAATATGGRTIAVNATLDGNSVVLVSATSEISKARTIQIQTRSDGSPLGTFSSLQCAFNWGSGSAATDCPVVEWIRFEFEYTNI